MSAGELTLRHLLVERIGHQLYIRRLPKSEHSYHTTIENCRFDGVTAAAGAGAISGTVAIEFVKEGEEPQSDAPLIVFYDPSEQAANDGEATGANPEKAA